MLIPYGVANFLALRSRGQLFVDHTRYLRDLEQVADQVIFLRPRRFGKSLWLSIMEHYYDVRFADRFAELFGDLAIGAAPTPLNHRFLVLRLDFSDVDTTGDDTRLHRSLGLAVRSHAIAFLKTHAPWVPEAEEALSRLQVLEDPLAVLTELLTAASQATLPVYLLIDEYDNFTNELISSRQEERYLLLVRGTGLLKTFFKSLKKATGTGTIARTFITGVNPLLLDDLTSGFNIALNLSLWPRFAGMLGFTAVETAALLEQARQVAQGLAPEPLPDAQALAELATAWYDGYRFDPDGPSLFNPDMVLYLLLHLVEGRLPRELLDQNLRTDLGKLRLVVRTAGDFKRFWSMLERDGRVVGTPASSFGLESMAQPIHFHSLLYYLGMLTFGPGPARGLRIPNYVVRTLYWTEARRLAEQRLELDSLDALQEALASLIGEGVGEPFFRLLLEEVIVRASKRDLIHFNEAAVKATALAFLSLAADISVFSEWETSRGYADLVLVPAPAATWLTHAWMIELKYLKQGEDSPAARARLLAEGREQLQRYLADAKRMAYLSRYTLHTAVALFVDAAELVWEPGPEVAARRV